MLLIWIIISYEIFIPFEDLIKTETPESPHTIASPTSLPDSTPPACHAGESDDSNTSGARSTSSDSTAPLSPDHPLTRTSPIPTPTRASFYHRTARMIVRAQPVMSPGHSVRVTEAMALLDLAFRKRYRSSYETPSSSSPLAFPVRKRYRGTSELILDTDSEEDEIGEEDTDEDEGHGLDDEGHGLDDEGHGLDDEGRSVKSDRFGYGALRRRELAVEEDQVYSTFEVGQGSGSVTEPERPERVSALRQPTLTTWIDPEDGITYIDVPAYPPPAPPAQTPPSPEWSFGSLPISPAPSVAPSPISSPMISLTVPSPIASPDHTQRLDAMLSTLFADIDKDVRELYTRSGVVRDDIFSHRYKFRSLELEQERTAVMFGALWRLVLALEAWAGSLGESEETLLEETISLEDQCIELGNGTSLWMIVVEDSS
ncbi:hypothetical protein Tco_0890871 [Tanacetum coccineum]|uniref:Uncharacterized protein n=1 Tax=Tanacetum coccineum TaxID=301880 RepID=A0ABQ5C7A8_9ASTR